MNSERLRRLIMGAAIAALAGWYGLTQWQPAASLAADGDDGAELGETLEDLAASLGESEAASVGGRTDRAMMGATTWPADPFFAKCDTTGGTDEADHGNSAADPASRFVLAGIIAGHPPLAIISGTVVSEGDELAADVVVETIDELFVTLRDHGETRVLRLPR